MSKNENDYVMVPWTCRGPLCRCAVFRLGPPLKNKWRKYGKPSLDSPNFCRCGHRQVMHMRKVTK